MILCLQAVLFSPVAYATRRAIDNRFARLFGADHDLGRLNERLRRIAS